MPGKQTIVWKKITAITYGEKLGAKQLCADLTEGEGELSYQPRKILCWEPVFTNSK